MLTGSSRFVPQVFTATGKRVLVGTRLLQGGGPPSLSFLRVRRGRFAMLALLTGLALLGATMEVGGDVDGPATVSLHDDQHAENLRAARAERAPWRSPMRPPRIHRVRDLRRAARLGSPHQCATTK